MHTIVSGVTGVGKTTWTRALASHAGGAVGAEAVDGELFRLAVRAGDANLWLLAQFHFLISAAEQQACASASPRPYFQDHSLYEVAEVYTPFLVRVGALTEAAAAAIHAVYDRARATLPPPDVVVHLRADVHVVRGRIAARGRRTDAVMPDAEITRLVEARVALWQRLGFPLLEHDVTNATAPVPGSPAVAELWNAIQAAAE